MGLTEDLFGDGLKYMAELKAIQKAVGMGDYTFDQFMAGLMFACIITYGAFHTRMIENLAGSIVPAMTQATSALGNLIPTT